MFVSIFNRIVMVVIALLLLAGAVITLLVSTGVSAPPEILSWFEPQLKAVAAATGNTAIGIVVVSVLVILGMIAILVLELTPLRESGSLLISSTEEGVITIDVKSICLLAEKTTAIIHSVRHVKCYTRETTGGLIISCKPTVLLGTNLLEVGATIQNNIKEAIEQFTGLTVAHVDVQTKYESVEARKLAVR